VKRTEVTVAQSPFRALHFEPTNAHSFVTVIPDAACFWPHIVRRYRHTALSNCSIQLCATDDGPVPTETCSSWCVVMLYQANNVHSLVPVVITEVTVAVG
jgi:hypothetical protein